VHTTTGSELMDAISNLHTRLSAPKVSGPAPSEQALDNIFKAALRAPDHGQLHPWRFLRIAGESLQRLATLFESAAAEDNPQLTEDERSSIRSKALRAPLVIAVISTAMPHPKIPMLEQDLSAGAAAHAMLLAAPAQGLGAIWRTGPMATHPVVLRGLGLPAHAKIIAFLYVGHPHGPARQPKELRVDEFVQRW